jgi:DNA-binding response OmpR family regulator
MPDATRPESPQGTILVVDDEPMLLRLVSRTLTDAGFRTLQARDGWAALELARGSLGSLSLVVTDINMPGMDGLEFARAFRPLHPTVPIIFISGRSDWPVAGEELLFKPFRAEVLLNTVARLLSSRQDADRNSA